MCKHKSRRSLGIEAWSAAAGSYGRVYRGTWQGKRVAVKVVDDASNVQMRDGKPMEAALTEGLTHTSICRLYAHAVSSSYLESYICRLSM